jgi:hypothetical protein
MGFAENFEDLQIWQRSRVLTNEIYDAFAKCRDLDYRSQIQRASVSVMNNIAEGFERRTKKTLRTFSICRKAHPAKFVPCSTLPKTAPNLSKPLAERLRADYKARSTGQRGGRLPQAGLKGFVAQERQNQILIVDEVLAVGDAEFQKKMPGQNEGCRQPWPRNSLELR